MKLTVSEYSKRFKMSKEMINSKLRLKKLDYTIEDSVTYIEVADEVQDKVAIEDEDAGQIMQETLSKPKTTVATVIALYQRENTQLKEKVTALESKIDKLIDDKEQMLRDERDKIEYLYAKKDEQLKNILELVNQKMLLQHKEQTIHEVETVLKEEAPQNIVELKSYLRTLNLKSFQRKVIKRRFLSIYETDERIIQKDGKLYLNFTNYDYTDLLA